MSEVFTSPSFSPVLLCPVSPPLSLSFVLHSPSFVVVLSIYYLLTTTVSLSVSLTFSLFVSTRSIKTNVTPRTYSIYFPAKVNLPPCNEDRSSLKRTGRWRQGEKRKRHIYFLHNWPDLMILEKILYARLIS